MTANCPIKPNETPLATPGGCVPGVVTVVWMRKPADPSPVLTYQTSVCTAGITSFTYSFDPEGTLPATGYTIADKINTVIKGERGANCSDPVHVKVCEDKTTIKALDSTQCDGSTVDVEVSGGVQQVANAPGTALSVKLCGPIANLNIEFSETLMHSASTEQSIFRIRKYNEDLGTWGLVYENLDGTPFIGPLPADLAVQSAQVNVAQSTLAGCADGAAYGLRTTQRFDAETGTLESTLVEYLNADGVASTTKPANFVLGACLSGVIWYPEPGNWCYGNDTGGSPTLQAGDQIVEPSTGLPLGATQHGATSAADSYIHAMYGIHNGNNVGDFNADDATTPFDSSTHGGILLTDVAKVQAVTDLAVTAIEAAELTANPAFVLGTYKATYYLTTTNQAVWVYNAALWAVVGNGTYLHPYTGSTDVPGSYQEKHDINVASSLTAATLVGSGSVPVEVTKGIDQTGAVVGRRVWDDRTEPPTEIVGFDPLLLGQCPQTQYQPVGAYNKFGHQLVGGNTTSFGGFKTITVSVTSGTVQVTIDGVTVPYPVGFTASWTADNVQANQVDIDGTNGTAIVHTVGA